MGRLSELTIGQARALAMDYALAGRHGRDLVAERKAVDQPKLTLGDTYLAYMTALKRRGASENTIRLNTRNWSAYVSRHQSRELASITRADVRSWHTEWGQHGPTVANQTARLVRAVFNYALNKLTTSATENPCRAIEYFKERNLRRVVAAESLAEWWKAVDQIENPIRRGYWQVLLLTGLRKEDAATMKWVDVHLMHIHRPNPKGGATRAFDLPITQPLVKILTEMREAGSRMFPGSEYVFPAASAKGHIVCPREEKHIPNCSPHDLRRTYATLCIQAGVDPYTTKMLLNHAPDTSDVTARYIIPSADACRAAAERVAQYILVLVA